MSFAFEKALEAIRNMPEPKFGEGQTVQKDNMAELWRIERVRPQTWLKDWIFYHYDLVNAKGEYRLDVAEHHLIAIKLSDIEMVRMLMAKAPTIITLPIKRLPHWNEAE